MGGHLRSASKFGTDPDDDLLVYISIDSAGEDGRAAATELYLRHSQALFRILKRFWPGRLLGDEGLVDLVQDTFRAVLESAGTFKPKGGDAAQQRRACLNWLVGVARNQLRQRLQRPVSVAAEVVLDDCEDLAAEVLLSENVDEQNVGKLVEAARKDTTTQDENRQYITAAYTFMSAMAGDFPLFEEATRALFAQDFAKFETCMDNWPPDIRYELMLFLQNVLPKP